LYGFWFQYIINDFIVKSVRKNHPMKLLQDPSLSLNIITAFTTTSASGDVYIGHFSKGKFSGKGKYYFTDGSNVEGQFVDGNVVDNFAVQDAPRARDGAVLRAP
jgi:hypothetical protein